MKPILEINNIGKKYRLRHQTGAYLSFRERLSDVFSRQKETNEDFWALRNVSLNVFPGDSIGIIGRNGAGKSTLLKILSRITPPTAGRIINRGRIASLLEVGTGFHPELSGRENIFLNGSLLGMKRREIESKFDEIVDFSGVEKFLDTPLKHFSSGMQLRLAFAVAAFLEPEILIIDEVLAVGDAEFQKKCIGKMEAVSNSGRTILFVSHNLPTLKSICKRGILLEKGKVAYEGDAAAAIHQYMTWNSENHTILQGLRYFRDVEKVNSISINGSEQNSVALHSPRAVVEVEVMLPRSMNFELQIHLKKDDVIVCSFANFVTQGTRLYEAGTYRLRYDIAFAHVRSGTYVLDIYFTEPFVSWFAISTNDIEVEILSDEHDVFLNGAAFDAWGTVLLQGEVKVERVR